MQQTNHTLLLDIMARLYPPLPCVPDNALPSAGDTVVLRNGNTAVVMGVEIDRDDFDEPKFYLNIGIKVTRYAITGVQVARRAA